MSDTLSWAEHYHLISARALRALGLLRHTFSKANSIKAKKLLYLSTV